MTQITATQAQGIIDQLLNLAHNNVEDAAHMLVELSATLICAVVRDPEERIAAANVFHRGMLGIIANLPTGIEPEAKPEDSP